MDFPTSTQQDAWLVNTDCVYPTYEFAWAMGRGKHVWNSPKYCDKCLQWHRWCGVCGDKVDVPKPEQPR